MNRILNLKKQKECNFQAQKTKEWNFKLQQPKLQFGLTMCKLSEVICQGRKAGGARLAFDKLVNWTPNLTLRWRGDNNHTPLSTADTARLAPPRL